ncbi:uncharacterized protein LY89DRAFT_731000 [Mollisia scopiformis]|uniref:F-box domain-containing protein n=1 Tax=Mollisia scopiformis TaxID=149040 RepID=A0A194XHX9_MOLSC|nr:uncharacterized protein LY89DRAFT_731000 [Mollisia scopiformis]KUJ19741.1 hypothetical protein LY89DRAFT_731000 [Mollisia scopiformis]
MEREEGTNGTGSGQVVLGSMTIIVGHDQHTYIMRLPAGLKVKIFEQMNRDHVNAVCLGLTCKRFYQVYKKYREVTFTHRPKPICAIDSWTRSHPPLELHELIRNFFPREARYVYVEGVGGKFVFDAWARQAVQRRLERHMISGSSQQT